MTIKYERFSRESEDRIFLTYILLEKSFTNIQVVAITSQRLSEIFQKSTVADKNLLLLLSYTHYFKSVFTKKEFDVLLEYYQQDHTLELISGSEPKSSKVYSLSSIEQADLNIFLLENLKTSYICSSKLSTAVPIFST